MIDVESPATTVIGRLRARRRAFRLRRFERRSAGRKLLNAFADMHPSPFFLEVGASDGVTDDHLRPYVLEHRWRGIMIEPVPYVFERLRRNYAGIDRVALENVAIADHDGVAEFHYFAENPQSAHGKATDISHALGSFSRDHVESFSHILDHDAEIVSTEVACCTLPSLLGRHDVERLDVVAIDTEGYDFEIIRQLDFAAYRPRVLVYEDVHLHSDHVACRELLEGLGYELLEEMFDTWCFDATIDDPLTSRWRRIQAAGPAVPRHKMQRWFESMAKDLG